jgi:hypothetical protein
MAITTSLWGHATIPGFLYAKVTSEAMTRSDRRSPRARRGLGISPPPSRPEICTHVNVYPGRIASGIECKQRCFGPPSRLPGRLS